MAALEYPAGLPCPIAAPYQAAERRGLSSIPGPRQSAPRQLDRLAGQELQFFFTREHLAIWTAWLADPLIQAGAWFAARWPTPAGGVFVCRFLGAPSYPTFYPFVGWMVSARVEVRGRGMLPTYTPTDCADAALAAIAAEDDSLYVYQNYYDTAFIGDPGGTEEGTYFGYATFGLAEPPWTFSFSVPWSDLAAPPGVTVFSGTRNGSVDSPDVSISITDPPGSGRFCRACVAQSYGGWGGLTVNGGLSATSHTDGGAGYWASQFLIVCDDGVITFEGV